MSLVDQQTIEIDVVVDERQYTVDVATALIGEIDTIVKSDPVIPVSIQDIPELLVEIDLDNLDLTTSGPRTFYGVVKRLFGVFFVTNGTRVGGITKQYGVVARPITFGKAVSARRRTTASVAAAFTFSKSVSGINSTPSGSGYGAGLYGSGLYPGSSSPYSNGLYGAGIYPGIISDLYGDSLYGDGVYGDSSQIVQVGSLDRPIIFGAVVAGNKVTLPAKQTAVAEISLASHTTPSIRTNHTIKIRARTLTGSIGVINAALYEGATNRSGDLTSQVLTNSLGDYTLVIPDAAAAAITSYANLSIRFWGYDSSGAGLVFEVSRVALNLPITYTAKQTSVAEISLASHGIPNVRTNHTIKIRARTTSGSTGVIKAALYEGATNRSGDLTTAFLTNSLSDYVLQIPDASAAAITSYANLSLKIWGYDYTGAALVFEVAQVSLNLPATITTPKQTPVAEISLASHVEPATRTNHTIKVRARTTSGSTGVIKAALYEGATNRSGDLTSQVLTNSLGDYTLVIPDASAAAITSYSNLSIRIWGYDSTGAALVFEVSRVYLNLPVSAGSLPTQSTVYFGARIDGAFYQANYGAPTLNDAPWASVDAAPNNWDLFEQHAGKAISAVHWGGLGNAIGTFDKTANTRAHSRGAFSNYSMSASTQDILDLAANTDVRGAITRVRTFATDIQSQGFPLMLRPWWEMNGNWGWTHQTAAGISAATYVAAWQRLYIEITAIANCISFFWCANIIEATIPDPTPWYPGTAYVDWVGFDGYCKGAYQSPATLFNETLAVVNGLTGNTKPVGIGETGVEAPTGSPGKAAWITDFFNVWLPAHPEVKLVSWFNETGNPVRPHIELGDAQTAFGAQAQTAFSTQIANSRYLSNVAGSFPSNAKIPIPVGVGTAYGTVGRAFTFGKAVAGIGGGASAKQTSVAQISLASHGTPAARTNHSIKIRARTVSGSGGIINAALYEGTTNISGDLSGGPLTNSFVDYTLSIPNVSAAAITSYANLSIKIWGTNTGAALVFDISRVCLVLPPT